MEISRWGAGKSVEGIPGQMVRVTRDEALKLVESLSRQLRTGKDDGRAEFNAAADGTVEYFSISVADPATEGNRPEPPRHLRGGRGGADGGGGGAVRRGRG